MSTCINFQRPKTVERVYRNPEGNFLDSTPSVTFSILDESGVVDIVLFLTGKRGIEFLRALKVVVSDELRWLEGRVCAECLGNPPSASGAIPALCDPCAMKLFPGQNTGAQR